MKAKWSTDSMFVRDLTHAEEGFYDAFTDVSIDGTRAVLQIGSARFYLQSAEGTPDEVEDARRALAIALVDLVGRVGRGEGA